MISKTKALNFIQCARFNRISQNDLLREENAELLRIIADFDTRLAEVEAERDELKRQWDALKTMNIVNFQQLRDMRPIAPSTVFPH